MCLEEYSVSRLKIAMRSDDFERVKSIYTVLWKRLNHDRIYCLNPEILAFELLRRSKGAPRSENDMLSYLGKTKIQSYTETIDYMWKVTFPDTSSDYV